MSTLPESDRNLVDLLLDLVTSREAELERVSRFLHDDVGQVLTSVGFQLDVLGSDLRDREPEAVRRLKEIQQLLELSVTRIRKLSSELNPSVVERAGLQFALERLVGGFRTSFPGSLRLLFDPSIRVPLPIANALYDIADLAIRNAVQHAQCSQIEVLMKPGPQAAVLEIRDNGLGFPEPGSAPRKTGLGLLLMKRSAARAGINLSITSKPGKGSIIKAQYLRADPDQDGEKRSARASC